MSDTTLVEPEVVPEMPPYIPPALVEAMVEENGKMVKKAIPKHERIINYIGVLMPAVQAFHKDSKVQAIAKEMLTLDPEMINSISIETLNKYIFTVPRILVFLHDCKNMAQIRLAEAEYKYQDRITDLAASLDKNHFKGFSSVTKEMRTAIVKKMHPREYAEIVSEVRACEQSVMRLKDQADTFKILSDNLKNIKNSMAELNKRNTGSGE